MSSTDLTATDPNTVGVLPRIASPTELWMGLFQQYNSNVTRQGPGLKPIPKIADGADNPQAGREYGSGKNKAFSYDRKATPQKDIIRR